MTRLLISVPSKLVWVMLAMLVTAVVVWWIRRWWVQCHPQTDPRIKYSRRLAMRFKQRSVDRPRVRKCKSAVLRKPPAGRKI
jgi:hypothetical protein